jgi:hypothetical protein
MNEPAYCIINSIRFIYITSLLADLLMLVFKELLRLFVFLNLYFIPKVTFPRFYCF